MSASYAAEGELRRSRILAATVGHVPFDGWTWRAVARGARDAGYPEPEAHLAFPDGIREVAAAYTAELNRRMQEAMDARGTESGAMKIRERVALAVRLRLESAGAEREAVRRLAAFLALPENMGLGPRLLWTTVDAVWRAAGDRSADFSYYTKRGLLAGVVGATTLYWLTDESEGFADTWAFLDRRIEDVMRVGGLPRRLGAWMEAKFEQGADALFRRPRRWTAPGTGARRRAANAESDGSARP
jgi:ubiquinone biosynthesis protein COQ9